ncbi:MAG: methylmalonyl-CoA epimerase [Candidatus Krumholzibacteria bacterium]|nr:methylmalonyl-CoA epimerase [Candidatus Krumholzibacteria bacterium]
MQDDIGIQRIDHIAIAVERLDDALAIFERVLGLKATHRERVDDQRVDVATLHLGETAIELVAPATPDSPIAKYLEKRGPGIHHIALEVRDIAAAIAALQARSVEMIDAVPRAGKEGSQVAFIHPKATGRVLVELVEPAR